MFGPKDGEHLALLSNSLSGMSMKKLTTHEFIQRARKVHGNKYDYQTKLCTQECLFLLFSFALPTVNS